MDTYRPGLINRFPVEILLSIFSEFMWDGSEPSALPIIGDVKWFLHVRTLKALQLVCRDWCEIISPTLYSTVYLRGIAQLSALVRTLDERQATGRAISHCVNRVFCELYVPLSRAQLYSENLARLISLCHGIRSLVHRPIFDDNMPEHSRLALLRVLRFGNPLPDLRELQMTEPALIDAQPGTVFSRFSRLTTLRIAIDSRQGPPTEVTLPELDTLVCDFTSIHTQHSARIIAHFWKLPKLQHLSVIYNCPETRDGVSLLPVELICRSHGAGLRSLLVDNRCTFGAFQTGLRMILESCPDLIHLSYSNEFMPGLQAPLSVILPNSPMPMSRTLRQVSLLAYVVDDTQGWSLQSHVSQLSEREYFPCLETIEILDGRLRGESVNIHSLPPLYGESLQRCLLQATNRGVRLLNFDSYPLRIEYEQQDLDTDSSDEDYQPDSDTSSITSSSDSEDVDFAELSDELSLLTAQT